MDRFVQDFRAGMAFLRQQPFVIGDRIGMTGYCFGGGVTYAVAAVEPTLRAAAPYYGPVMDATGLRNNRAAVLGVYGETDNFVNPSIPAVEEALQAAGVAHRLVVYPNAGHAFFNDTQPNTGNFGYAQEAALAAWRDTLAWFNTYLRAGVLPATGDAGDPAELVEEVATEE
jgi:carboxymethylenebutenolidase